MEVNKILQNGGSYPRRNHRCKSWLGLAVGGVTLYTFLLTGFIVLTKHAVVQVCGISHLLCISVNIAFTKTQYRQQYCMWT